MVNKVVDKLQMDAEQIKKYANRFLRREYQIELIIPIVINARLSSTLGQLIYNKTNNRPVRLEFSKRYLINGDIEDIKKVIKHECIHYALFMKKLPYNDGDPYFEEELRKHNSIATDVISFKTLRNVRIYKCDCREYTFLQTISPKYCTRCDHDLTYVGNRKQLV